MTLPQKRQVASRDWSAKLIGAPQVGQVRVRQQAAAQQMARLRCSDCPLTEGRPDAPCPVHRRWLALLRRYGDGELSGQEYIHDTLKLLAAHKKRLKISQVSCVPGAPELAHG